MTGTRVPGQNLFGRRPEPSFGPVAVDRAADFAADGVSDPKAIFAALVLTGLLLPGLKNEAGRYPFMTGAGDTQKLAALFQPVHGSGLDVERHGQVGQP